MFLSFSKAEMSDPLLNPLTVICAGSCFAFSGLFYKLYSDKRLEVQKLKVHITASKETQLNTGLEQLQTHKLSFRCDPGPQNQS